MKVPLSDAPMRFRRTAMRHVDSVRDSQMPGPTARDAELGPEACPIFRPDLPDVAYWEFELRSSEHKAGEPGGFVVVATGDHDFPVSHWSLERPPVSFQLQQEAEKRGKVAARIYRLDALAYIAEDEEGNEVARSGQSLALPEGVPLAGGGAELSSLIASPKANGDERDDRHADRVEFDLERKGPKDPDIRLADPKDWANLKKAYKGRFEPFLDDVRKRAAHSWKIDRDVEEFGEGVLAGEPFNVRLLERDAKVEVMGKGKQDVTVEVEDKRRGPPLVRGKSTKRKHKEELDFELRVTYPKGEVETLRYFIVSPDTPSKAKGDRQAGGRQS